MRVLMTLEDQFFFEEFLFSYFWKWFVYHEDFSIFFEVWLSTVAFWICVFVELTGATKTRRQDPIEATDRSRPNLTGRSNLERTQSEAQRMSIFPEIAMLIFFPAILIDPLNGWFMRPEDRSRDGGPAAQLYGRPSSPQRTGLLGLLVGSTLQGINISHLGKRKIIFKMPFFGGYVSSLEGMHFFWIQ